MNFNSSNLANAHSNYFFTRILECSFQILTQGFSQNCLHSLKHSIAEQLVKLMHSESQYNHTVSTCYHISKIDMATSFSELPLESSLGAWYLIFSWSFLSSGPPSTPTLSCVKLSGDVSGAVNVTVSWTLSSGDRADFYLINITTNAPQILYVRILNITTASVTQHELIGFMAGYEYNITVRGMTTNCGGLVGRESEPLIITPQGMLGYCSNTYKCRSTLLVVVLSEIFMKAYLGLNPGWISVSFSPPIANYTRGM